MASVEKRKRERAVNFTDFEIRCLVDVALRYIYIIENKQTDAVTWREKDKAWVDIALEFNAVTGCINRTSKVLRLKYDGIKRALKQKQNRNKLEVFKTGGGTPHIQPLYDYEEKFLQFILLSVNGLPAENDSDIILSSVNLNRKNDVNENISFDENGIIEDDDVLQTPTSEPKARAIDSPYAILQEIYISEPVAGAVKEVAEVKHHNTVEEPSTSVNISGTWNPKQLKARKHKSLLTTQQKVIGKHTINQKIDALTESRKELLKLQIQMAEQEILQKQELHVMQKKLMHDRENREQQQHELLMKNLSMQQQLLTDAMARQEKEHKLRDKLLVLKTDKNSSSSSV